MEVYRQYLEKLEEAIRQHRQLADQFEKLILALPKDYISIDDSGKKPISPIAAYEMIQLQISRLQVERLRLLANMESLDRLETALDIAIMQEDYEKSARLRDQIDAIRNRE